MTTRCHSVFSRRSPVALSFQESDGATRRFAIGLPSWVRRISGSAPRLPTRITLLTLPAMTVLHSFGPLLDLLRCSIHPRPGPLPRKDIWGFPTGAGWLGL